MTARVLVVDDILPNIKLLEARLTAEYFDVLTAMSGPEALAICAEGNCDIVLLDVMMPGMDGPATLAALRREPSLADVPVIFITAKVQTSEVEYYTSLGAVAVISKPFDPMTLAADVRAIWERRPAP